MVCGGDNKKVDEDHKLYTKKFFQTKKLLLLGTGESGKTTIIKQMKILHINGFSEVERKEKIPFIRQNIHESIYDIVSNMSKINPPVEIHSVESKTSVEYILNLGPNEPSEYTDEYFDHVKIAWADKGVQDTYERSNEYQLIDSAAHFLNRLDEIRQPDYIPTTLDILFCRVMTVSISKIEFEVKYGGGVAEFWMYDVGGQRGQRKKWIQVFDGIQAILFIISASDFDQTLREDENKNRLEEAFSLFEDVYRSRFVRDAGLILFLNKQDLLKKKIDQGRKLEKYFPEYSNYQTKEGDPNSEYDRAKFFMKDKVEKIASTPLTIEHIGFVPGKNIHEKLPPRTIYTHFTVATDTNNIKKIFESVRDTILRHTIDVTFGTF
ncbi:guanine nucleotide-binding protein G(f) subunit alpha [Anoplophora glabripennis]|uniref:guanine nucleotide-binding protein G(f) subunit alpha n=1 Tax=Anoplophora glabripennis TaxID=217634 RepID=UPI000874D872|nr:guanine nucleotide-binding protein G(f) subunit alpha [Anoplophora glabripennis]